MKTIARYLDDMVQQMLSKTLRVAEKRESKSESEMARLYSVGKVDEDEVK